ncbi:POU class 2 homeobox associating factor 3 [Rhinophrynus dorsalis]
MTVKELLQQRRALQAEKNAPMVSLRMYPRISNACESTPAAPSCYQGRQFPNYISNEESLSFVDQLFIDAYLQPEPIRDATFNFMQSPPLCTPEEYIQQTPIFNQRMAPESPSDSSDISNSFEYSPSSEAMMYASQSYNSPSYQDTRSCATASVDHYYQHQTSSTFCYCLYCCSVEPREEMKSLDSCSYPYTDCIEYLPSSTVTEDFAREISTYDMCYS